ncbi:hypothetical protein ACQ86G_23530 [Roseateles chitinivorans]|uniref:hypothetical protein n=1 Tax=Roseateles chitinivorans TaxID=2917965 RepID=UPI003D66F0D0
MLDEKRVQGVVLDLHKIPLDRIRLKFHGRPRMADLNSRFDRSRQLILPAEVRGGMPQPLR